MSKKDRDPFIIQVEGGRIRDRRLRRSQSSDEGYVYSDASAKSWLHEAISAYKIKFAILLLLMLWLLLMGRLFYLQVLQGSYYRGLADGNRIRMTRIEPTRGIIYAANDEQLVRNQPSFSLQFIPGDLTRDDDMLNSIISQIASITNTESIELSKEIYENRELSFLPLPLLDSLTYEQAVLLRIKSADWSGFRVVDRSVRNYIHGPMTSHVLGYVSKITAEEYDNLQGEGYQLIDWLGKDGLEKYYEPQLRGEAGKKSIEVDSLGKELKILAQEDPVAGDNLYLYMSLALQQKLYAVMSDLMGQAQASRGAAVILDPRSGGILALLSWPSYDNNLFSEKLSSENFDNLFNNENKPLFNRAVAGQYPSGSTIKPLVAAAALQEDVINRWTTFNSVGGIYYDKWFFPDWKAGGHGTTDVVKAIAESVNTFFYRIGIDEYNDKSGLGLDRMVQYMRAFYLGRPLGVDLPGEKLGLVPTREWKWSHKQEAWYPGDTMHLAIGQGDILVTPLQLATYVAAIANDGIVWRPQLVKEISPANSDVRHSSVPEVLASDIIDSQNLAIVRQGMRQAVLYGSAQRLNVSTYEAAAKTGTAQVGGDQLPHSWFVGFAPYDNPQLIWAVVVENGGESNDLAVPIMRQVLDWYFSQDQ